MQNLISILIGGEGGLSRLCGLRLRSLLLLSPPGLRSSAPLSLGRDSQRRRRWPAGFRPRGSRKQIGSVVGKTSFSFAAMVGACVLSRLVMAALLVTRLVMGPGASHVSTSGSHLDGTSSLDSLTHHDGFAGDPDALGDTTSSSSSFSFLSPVDHKLSIGAGALPGWLNDSPLVGALTSFADEIPTKGDSLVDGVVVRIAPKFVVTSADLLSSRGLGRLRNASIQSRTVVFSGGSAQVTRVVLESHHNKNSPLIVLELDSALEDAPYARVVMSQPNKDFEYEQLALLNVASVLDTKALLSSTFEGRVVNNVPPMESKLTFFVEPMCGYDISSGNDTFSPTQLCVGQLTKRNTSSYFDAEIWHHQRQLSRASNDDPKRPSDGSQPRNSTRVVGSHRAPTWPQLTNPGNSDHKDHKANRSMDIHAPATDVGAIGLQGAQFKRPAILFYGTDLVGLSIPVMAVPKRFQTPDDNKYGFIRLAAPEHRAFLDAATSRTVQYNEDDVFSKASKYPSYLASFLSSTGQQVNCQGVLIAPRYVLTTASCLKTQSDIRAVQFFASDATQRETVNIVSGRTAIHPRYTEGDVTFDTAVIGLEKAVAFAPIQLDDGSVDDSANFARIQMADDRCVISATMPVSSSDTCRTARGDKLRPADAFCVRPLATPETAPAFSVKDFVGDESIATFNAQPVTTTGAALVTVTKASSVALVGLAVASSSTNAGRGLQSAGDGEIYVRVANSATFINAYVAEASWSMSTAKILEAPDVELPKTEQFIVGLRTTRDGQNYCGGSLIGPTSVLTAAHCVVDGPAHFVSIGAYNSSGVEAEVIAVVASKTMIHSHYGKPHQFSYDVAILELEYASAVEPVQLDNTADFVSRETATMYGYGMSSATSGLSPSLRAVAMPLWSRAACEQVFGDEVDDSMLCAGGEKGKDACTGDSGSPLVLNRAGKNVLVGVVSAGSGCGLANVPGVYARIHAVKDFVSTHAIGVEWGTTDSSTAGGSNANSSTGSVGASSATQNATSIEAREATNSTTGTQPSASTTTPKPASGPYSTTELALSALSQLIRESLMDFLLGSDSERFVDSTMFNEMKASDTVLHFFSTAPLDALLTIVTRHNMSPLNQRRDRFDRWRQANAIGSGKACSAGVLG